MNERLNDTYEKVLNKGKYLYEETSKVKDMFRQFEHEGASKEIIAESVSEYVNVMSQMYDQFMDAYFELCELSSFNPNWRN